METPVPSVFVSRNFMCFLFIFPCDVLVYFALLQQYTRLSKLYKNLFWLIVLEAEKPRSMESISALLLVRDHFMLHPVMAGKRKGKLSGPTSKCMQDRQWADPFYNSPFL
jgi:hypothetical protein